jgi:hypothetical protein
MGTVIEIIDAVKGLTPVERRELFARLHDSGIGPREDLPRADVARYESEDFTRELTKCFHSAKRRALEAD